jgi:tetratricopeptide (TPR) repeat protein
VIGTTLEHYTIVRKLGSGGMGEVYLAEDQRLGRPVALKLLPPYLAEDLERRRRFEREARALAALSHPNVVAVHSIERSGELQFFTMEWVRGEPLSRLLRPEGLELRDFFELAERLADGLAAAHRQGVLHRDLKPDNVVVTEEGQPKIVDFGLALLKPAEEQSFSDRTTGYRTEPGRVLGTAPYLSPEQAEGRPVDQRSDLFSLGAVLYEMATGRRPFLGDSRAAVISAILRDDPPRPSKLRPELSPALDAVLLRCLAKRPEGRYADALRLRTALAAARRQQPAVSRWPGGRKRGLALAGLGLLAAGALLLAQAWLPQAGRPPAASAARRSIAVLGFKGLDEQLHSAWLSTALGEMLATELAAGGALRVVPGESVARGKLELGLAEADGFAPDTLRRIGRNLAADLVLLGSYTTSGPPEALRLRLDLRLQRTADGETLARLAETGALADLDRLVLSAGRELRRRLGLEPLHETDRSSVLRAALPASAEAARAYTEGLDALRAYDFQAAVAALQKAVALEPGHAYSFRALAEAYRQLDYGALAVEASRRAFELAESLPHDERLAVEAAYRLMTEEREKAAELYRALFTVFPDRLDFGLALAETQALAGRPHEALSTIEALRALPPPLRDDPRIELAEASAAKALEDQPRVREAAARAADKARGRGAVLLVAEARIAEGRAWLQQGQPQRALEAFEEARRIYVRADPLAVARALLYVGDALRARLDPAAAREAYEASRALFRELGHKSGVPVAIVRLAGLLHDAGALAESRGLYEEALPLRREVGNWTALSWDLVELGSVLLDQGVESEAHKRIEEGRTLLAELGGGQEWARRHLAWMTLLQARVELGAGRLQEAETLARQAADQLQSLDLADPSDLALATRALALLEQGRSEEAQRMIRRAAGRWEQIARPRTALAVALAAGRVAMADGSAAGQERAQRLLQAALARAAERGIKGLELEARLELAALDLAARRASDARSRLEALALEAAGLGFEPIRRRAARLAGGG